jgi:hypothetical protein
MYLDFDNNVRVMWKDMDTTIAATAAHPINQWVNTSISIPDANPKTSMGYNTYLFFQQANNHITAYNMTFDAENSSVDNAPEFTLDSPSLPGTHIHVWRVDLNKQAVPLHQLNVFHQQTGDDIIQTTWDLSTLQLSSAAVPIPAT